MASWRIVFFILPATFCSLTIPVYGHGHHGNCGPRTSFCDGCSSREHDCYGCGAASTGNRWRDSASAANFETLEGKIAEIVYLAGATPESGLVELRLLSAGVRIPVRLGPSGFLKQQQLTLKEGDAITVTGYRIAAGDGDLFIAAEVKAHGKSFRLRDTKGRPAW